MIWLVFALLTGACVFCVLWPLARPNDIRPRAGSDAQFYRQQLAEIDRDVARGLIAGDDAGRARAEAARRLIAAGNVAASKVPRSSGRSRKRWAAAVALLGIPALSLSMYARIGNPDLPDQPLEARLKAPLQDLDISAAVARIEAYLLSHPDDGKGNEVIAPVYMRLGRFDDAVRSYAAALQILGETAERQTAYGEALVYAADGVVTSDARKSFERALQRDASFAMAHYYLALGAEQDGDLARARDGWSKLVDGAPPHAPWLEAARARLAAIDIKIGGAAQPTDQAADIAALPADARDAAIRQMVDRLASRLAADGHDADGWFRLVRAYIVLHEPARARDALDTARRQLAQDSAALTRLDAIAGELGLGH